MGNQPSSSPPPRPIYTVRSEPWPHDDHTNTDDTTHKSGAARIFTSTEPADSDECHACAAGPDSAAIQPADAANTITSPYSTTSAQPLRTTTASSSLPAAFTTPTATTTTNAPITHSANSTPPPPCYAYSHSACPLNRAELGRAAWAYLHTLAAYYPLQPSVQQQSDMRRLMVLMMSQYPCLYCRDRSMEEVERNAPRVTSRGALSEWVCELHNEVNERLGKPSFDCRRVDERWRTGPSDGSCGGG